MSREERQKGQPIKVVILGDTGVGKSSLALRFVSDEFRPYSDSTIGASYMSKSITFSPEEVFTKDPETEENSSDSTTNEKTDTLKTNSTNNTPITTNNNPRKVHFKIWDTAGQEKYRSLAPMYYRGAGAALLVYDVTTRSSFRTLQGWVSELRHNGPPDLVLGVCGNKTDLGSREVDEDEARAYAEEKLGCFYLETSAKANINVYETFLNLAKRIPYEVSYDDMGLDLSETSRGGGLDLGYSSGSMRQRCC